MVKQARLLRSILRKKGVKQATLNPRRKIVAKNHGGKFWSFSCHVGRCSNLDGGTYGTSKDTQKKQTGKNLLLTDLEGSESNEDRDEYLFQSIKGVVIKEASDRGGKEALSKGSSDMEAFSIGGKESNAPVENNQRGRNDDVV